MPLVVVGMDAQQIQRVTDSELCWASSTLLETRGRQFPTIENEIARRGLNCGGEGATAQTAELGNEVMMDPAGVEPPAQSAGTQTSVLRNVNVRAGPGTEHAVRRVLRAGETVMVLRVLGTWCECLDGSATVYVNCANLAPPAGGWARLMTGSSGGDLRFAQGTSYPQVRRRLLEAGWRPFPLRGRYARGCQPNQACMGFPETAFCTGTGMNSCWYSWRRGEEYLLATASGENSEDGQAFDELRQCSRLVYSDDGHPWGWCQPLVSQSSRGTITCRNDPTPEPIPPPGNLQFMLCNRSGQSVVRFFAHPVGGNPSVDDVEGIITFVNGRRSSFMIPHRRQICLWNLRFSLEGRSHYVLNNINLCRSTEVTLLANGVARTAPWSVTRIAGPVGQMQNGAVSLPLQTGQYVDVNVACSNGSMATTAVFDGRVLGFGLSGSAAVEQVRMLSRGVYAGRITWERGERVNIPVRIQVINRTAFSVGRTRYRWCARL